MRDFTFYDEQKRFIPTVKARIFLKDPLVAAQRDENPVPDEKTIKDLKHRCRRRISTDGDDRM